MQQGQQQKVFANGMIVKPRHPNAPDYVKGNLSIKVDEFIQTLQQNNNNGWVNISIKQSQNGKNYAEIDTWRPAQQAQAPQPMQQAPAPQAPQAPQQAPQAPQQAPQGAYPPPTNDSFNFGANADDQINF